jgi:metal-dependent hydrolase (beta-lactamase superfamily II)
VQPEALIMLGVDPAKLDVLLLSHGHFDHYGGVDRFSAEAACLPGKRANHRKPADLIT